MPSCRLSKEKTRSADKKKIKRELQESLANILET
jgi:hypothetical protein